ncbi:MAG: response regulator [bacterium]
MKDAKQILIIDDEEAIADILARRFERLGFRVFKEHDGAEAIEVLKNETIQLVICDVKMPNGVSGSDVLKAAQRYNPGSQFVAISGHLHSHDSVKAIMNEGATCFIKKPFPCLREVTQKIAGLIA